MQIKKMKETGQQSYAAGALGGRGALSMSPKQPSASRAPRPERHGAPALLYPGVEAEAALLSSATCTQCRSVHDVPLHDLNKGPGSSQREDGYVCFRCNFRVAPTPLHYTSKNPSPTRVAQDTEPAVDSAGNKFKVRNFKPGKHYCDKCRFSTKDPLQYRKHTLQHEEIKFICSHCSCVSYTKGEFQRHLVKHTGVFPYRCEYCDYGAVRNDYIVKHRKRVHERPGGRRLPRAAARPELHRVGAKPSPEPSKAASPRGALQGKVSDHLARFPPPAPQDEGHSLLPLPEPKGFQKDVVCVPNRGALAEPGEAGLFENKSVEVEVLSPAQEPVQPGVPLTVVAPAELVVPANCLAQLMDVKVVNGTQQLVLKLFPLEESNGLDTAGRDWGDAERTARDKGSWEREAAAGAEPTKALALEGDVGRLAGLHRLQASVQRRLKDMKWVRSYEVFMSNSSAHGLGESPLSPEVAEELQRKSHFYLHRTDLPAFAFKGSLPPSSVIKNGVLCDLGRASNTFPYKAAAAFPEHRRGSHREAPPPFPFPVAAPHSADKGLLPASKNGLAPRRELAVRARVGSARKLGLQPEQPHAAPSPGQVPSPPRGECPPRALPGEGRARPPADSPWDLKNSERTSDSFDGPVISSVFSLSSGSENVPEGIKWSSSTSKIKSIELLRKKIAKLIESCGKPSSLAASAHGPPGGQASKIGSKAVPECHGEIIGCSSGTLLKPRGDGRAGGLPPHPQMRPQFADGRRGDADGRATRKAHVATPVLIPKGAVLRVLNSSEDAHIIEATCDTPVSIPCSKTQLIKPLPFCPVRHADSRALPGAGGPADSHPDPSLALRPKPRKESAFCSLAPKKAGPPQVQQGSGAFSKPGKLLPRSLPSSKNKTRQVNPSKKKSKVQPDPGRCLKDPAILQVARQLRLVAAKPGQLIKCPRRNQPVIVLNHPDVDSPEVTNVMKVINKYKGNVLKVVLSERTRCQLGIRRHHVRLTYRDVEEANQVKRQMMLKMKLKKVHKNNYQVVGPLPDDAAPCIFKCWFCGRLYEDQEEWMSHGQRHLIEATRDWDVLSSKVK
ncbi:zinc finger protein 518B isoform X2 [Talpa occidentalis]|uniref:zinc finger protein 518B isoform X2 n=1 Tax=Talpa occidentalis TaxID=50954 RepID=UPI00188DF063|nr:zinc finger protein 518B isoform X2 [Talpa occidentalis]